MATRVRKISKDVGGGAYGAGLHDQLAADPTLAASDFRGINILGDDITAYWDTEPTVAVETAFDAVLTAHAAESATPAPTIIVLADGSKAELVKGASGAALEWQVKA